MSLLFRSPGTGGALDRAAARTDWAWSKNEFLRGARSVPVNGPQLSSRPSHSLDTLTVWSGRAYSPNALFGGSNPYPRLPSRYRCQAR